MKRHRTRKPIFVEKTIYADYQKVLERIRRLNKKLGRSPKASEWDSPGIPTYAAIIYYHNTNWNEMLEDAGLHVRVKYGWTEKKCKTVFLDLLKKKEVIPTGSSFNSHEALPSTRTIRALFGNFKSFLNDCGVESIKELPTWQQWEWCVERIAEAKFKCEIEVQVTDKHVKGRPDITIPKYKIIVDAMTTSYSSEQKKKEIKKYTKGFDLEFWCLFKQRHEFHNIKHRYSEELLKTKGLDRDVIQIVNELREKYRSDLIKERLLKDIYKAYTSDTRPKIRKLKLHGLKTTKFYESIFGMRFRDIMKLAKVPPPKKRILTSHEKIIDELKRLYKKTGGPITDKIVRKHSVVDKRTFKVRFGSLQKACKKAKVPYKILNKKLKSTTPTKDWPYKRVIKRVKTLAKKLKRPPKAKEWDAPGVPTVVAILRKYDKKWNDLIRAAGLKANERTKKV